MNEYTKQRLPLKLLLNFTYSFNRLQEKCASMEKSDSSEDRGSEDTEDDELCGGLERSSSTGSLAALGLYLIYKLLTYYIRYFC